MAEVTRLDDKGVKQPQRPTAPIQEQRGSTEESLVSWLTNPEEAAKHPRRVLAFLLFSGLAGGGAIGYFRFDGSPGWAVILGITFAAILTYAGWKSVRDPAWIERRASRRELPKGLLRLALPFVALAVAFVLGVATQSEHVFIVTFAISLGIGASL